MTLFQPILSLDNNLWLFDQFDFKDAITLLFLDHQMETDKNDLELKKLISMQFDNEVKMIAWAKKIFETVCCMNHNIIIISSIL